MNEKNLDYLKTRLKYMGFGEKLNEALEENIKKQPNEFQLRLTGEFNKGEQKDQVEYKLDFRKSDQTDMYFFNRYHATLKNEDPEKERTQTFYINNGTGITAKEAFNLLDGRSVNKVLLTAEEKPYNAWLQLNFEEKDKNNNYQVRQFHQGYGYDLDKTLDKYPVKELNDPEMKVRVMESLEKGNLQQVTFEKNGKEEKVFIEASPQYKNLNVYNAKMEKQFQGMDHGIRTVKEPDMKKEKKASVKEDPDDEGSPEKNKKNSKRKGMSV